jgi:hypothetical protein
MEQCTGHLGLCVSYSFLVKIRSQGLWRSRQKLGSRDCSVEYYLISWGAEERDGACVKASKGKPHELSFKAQFGVRQLRK